MVEQLIGFLPEDRCGSSSGLAGAPWCQDTSAGGLSPACTLSVPRRQIMLYSATFPVTVKAFKEKFLRWVQHSGVAVRVRSGGLVRRGPALGNP